jgi:UDP-N-acetylglucosamine-lysosomal-enzyme
MHWSGYRKRFQKRSFDLLSHRYGVLVIVLSVVVITVAVVQFGETLVQWSSEKYAVVFNSFSDNVASRSFRTRLCLPVPIDIVYTWVNGSDPRLLDDLRAYQRALTNELQTTDNETVATATTTAKCHFESCVLAAGVVIDPPVPAAIGLKQFAVLYPSFGRARQLQTLKDLTTNHNVSVVLFNQVDDAEAAVSAAGVVIDGRTASIRQLYYTTDKTLHNGVASVDTVIMTGFPDVQNKEVILDYLPSGYRNHITNVLLYQDRGIAVLTISEEDTVKALLTTKNLTISGKSPTFALARLVWDLTDHSKHEDLSASRFEDNEELRYSLRSVERHAPWIRHVFIVTNGQIPSWLNLDYERVTVVTHAEIFPNASHLPTFSSPAIESHLHRIPGLSDRFIYMNDDVMFGRDVWPDDFISPSGRQKIYLTYPVPNCREGCPSSWIADGYCDRACNNSQCEWDGGDCVGGRNQVQYPVYGGGAGVIGSSQHSSNHLYCNPGCANNWIADRYCDQSCNVRACAFDAGDCGTGDFHLFRRIDLGSGSNEYDVRGFDIFFFNLSAVLSGGGSIVGGSVTKDDILRSASIARKFKVATVLLHSNQSSRSLTFSFFFKTREGLNVTVSATVLVDTQNVTNETGSSLEQTTSSSQQAIVERDSAAVEDVEIDSFVVSNLTSVKFPRPKYATNGRDDSELPPPPGSILDYDLPEEFQAEYKHLTEQLQAGDLTQTGFEHLTGSLWARFVRQLRSEGRMPVLVRKQTNVTLQVNGDQISTASDDADVTVSLNGLKHHLNKVARSKRGSTTAAVVTSMKVVDDSAVKRGRSLLSVEGEYQPKVETELADWQKDVNVGFLPWEKKGLFANLQERVLRSRAAGAYAADSSATRRRLLDSYADSLRHVSRVYNRAYGFSARRVPAHMPHLIDRQIMAELQTRFSNEWDDTSSHRVRQADDMQFAFAYFYFLISERANVSVDEVFDELDVDMSGVLSDRELRILATRIYELPLDLKTLEGFEQMLINCSQTAPVVANRSAVSRPEVYYEKRLPQVTRTLVMLCDPMVKLLEKYTKSKPKYRHETVAGDEDVFFKMLSANVSKVVATLDEVRRDMRKFICLNDNIDYRQASAKMVKIVMKDFYESFMPTPSRFELPLQYRNRFLHVDDLHDWWQVRKWLRWGSQIVLLCVFLFAVLSFFSDRVSSIVRRWSRR